ncbi:MAG: hypothetical protein ACI89M_001775, partial [Chitinophagales bacterium]
MFLIRPNFQSFRTIRANIDALSILYQLTPKGF